MATVRLRLDPTQKILLKRGLNKNGRGQVFFTKECAMIISGWALIQNNLEEQLWLDLEKK